MNPSPRSILVVGAGVAGLAAIEAIRSQDLDARVTLLHDDPHGYYSRPGIAYYLNGEIPEKALFPFQKQRFSQLRVNTVLGHVVRLLPQERQVELHDGKRFDYDALLLATGSQAAMPDIPGIDLEGVVKLDDLADVQKILHLKRRTRTAVVIGGGITALEIVEGLAARRVKVHYFLRGDRYWSSLLDEAESRIVEDRLKHEGVTIHYHCEAEAILGKKGKVTGVLTRDGKTIPCEMVGIAIGVRPRIELAAQAGIRLERGVLVDEFLRTSIPGIYAAGDIAQVYDPLSGKAVLDVLWNPAREQGWIAGWNMAGKQAPYRKKAPLNVTRMSGLTTTFIGMISQGRQDLDTVAISRGDSETWRSLPQALVAEKHSEVNRIRLLLREQRMVGAIIMGDQALSYPIQHIINNNIDLSPIWDRLIQPNPPVTDLISEFWQSLNRGG